MHIIHQAKLPLTDGVADFLRANNFRDSFVEAGMQHLVPGLSAWNGARVDFLYHKSAMGSGVGAGTGAAGAMAVRDSAFLFHPASDHLPLVCDIGVV